MLWQNYTFYKKRTNYVLHLMANVKMYLPQMFCSLNFSLINSKQVWGCCNSSSIMKSVFKKEAHKHLLFNLASMRGFALQWTKFVYMFLLLFQILFGVSQRSSVKQYFSGVLVLPYTLPGRLGVWTEWSDYKSFLSRGQLHLYLHIRRDGC